MSMYQEAKERYAAWGVDADSAIARLKEIPVSIHCWQGDDVTGLENAGEALSGESGEAAQDIQLLNQEPHYRLAFASVEWLEEVMEELSPDPAEDPSTAASEAG